MKDKNKRNKLTRQIIEAFQEVPYPGDDNFAPVGDWERDGINALLRGKDWRDVHGTTFQSYSCALPLLEATVFCYYLPALMLNAIEEPTAPTYKDMLTTFTLYALEPDSILWKETSERLALLTTNQRQAILAFWRYYLRKHPIEQNFRRRQKRDILHFWRSALVMDMDRLKEAAKIYATKYHSDTMKMMAWLVENARERLAKNNTTTPRAI
jgi:hypothetical protein